jgi:heme-degrading monooxygenase HmoA
MWASRGAFDAWTQSDAFTQGHRGASMAGILGGHPHVELFESVTEVVGPRAPVSG